MPEHEPWLTALFNDHLASVANAARSLVTLPAIERPWSASASMEVLVALILVVLFAILRSQLSMDRPGKLQHAFEAIYNFLHKEADDNVGHDGHKFLSLFGTLFIFILFANLLGIIPGLESPTMFPEVPAGLALVEFLYYNGMGMREQGVGKYFAYFAGPNMCMGIIVNLFMAVQVI